jgi:excisionase family DNA binding protein
MIRDTLTTAQAAQMLGLHVNTIKNWVRDGRVPSFRTLGGHYRIRVDDLAETLRKHNIPIPAELRRVKFNVMAVDGDAGFIQRLIDAFAPHVEKFTLRTYNGGLDALLAATTGAPNLILIGSNITDIDGAQLLRKLKENSTFEKTIFIGVVETDDERGALRDAGASDTFIRGQEVRILLGKIQDAIGYKFLTTETA